MNGDDNTVRRAAIYVELETERLSNTDESGLTGSNDTLTTPWDWACYLTQQATGWIVGSAMSFDVDKLFRAAMVKVATAAVAAIESVDRKQTI